LVKIFNIIEVFAYSIVTGDLIELINAYFVPFGSKPCCFSDLKLYLPMVPKTKAESLMKKLMLSFDLKENELPQNVSIFLNSILHNFTFSFADTPNAEAHKPDQNIPLPWNPGESQH
jgi:hypothetical protein